MITVAVVALNGKVGEVVLLTIKKLPIGNMVVFYVF